MTQLVIPSCNLRSKYVRTIPINSVIIDPVNKMKYIIEEKKLQNNTLAKVASPYFGQEGGIEVQVDEHNLKLANPKRANPSMIMKHRIAELEAKVTELNQHLNTKSAYDQIKKHLNGEKYFDTGKYFYSAQDGIVFALRINGTMADMERLMEEYIKSVWKSPDLLHSLMMGQKKLQSKLLDALSKDSLEKEITFPAA